MSAAGYELLGELCRTYRSSLVGACRESDGKRVILKRALSGSQGSSSRQQLLAESQMLSKFNRLGIGGVPKAAGILEDDSNLFLVLESFPLDPVLPASGECLGVESVLKIGIQLARNLGDLHAQGVIYKEVCPKNLSIDSQSGEVFFVDFSMANESETAPAVLDSGRRTNRAPPYLSPEQTGRLQWGVDYRTDYYSLGVTLFELATASRPFEAKDFAGWVQVHLSQPAPRARERRAEISSTVSRIIERLMAKDPEHRYQSSRGLLKDLERCLEEFQSKGTVSEFSLGKYDVSEKFQISERLVGRDRQIERLLGAYERASRGAAHLLLVSGRSGSGKSALVRSVQNRSIRHAGRYVAGKFDPLDRHVPYGPLLSALSKLVSQILTEPNEILKDWAQRLENALGENLGVMVNAVPVLGHVVGDCPSAAPLAPQESANRLGAVLAQFLAVFATAEHPLVVFLDDLQWTDASTPRLLERLLLRHELKFLLVVLAYRDNEVDAGHLLNRSVQAIVAEKPDLVIHVRLDSLSEEDVTGIVAQALHRSRLDVEPLAAFVHEKTNGNVFFVREMLEWLHRAAAISLSPHDGQWCFDMARVRSASVTDNVAKLLVSRLAELPEASLKALGVAACVGSRVTLELLAHLLDWSESATARALDEPCRLGFVVLSGGGGDRSIRTKNALSEQGQSHSSYASYSFQHDRVKQAAYSMIEDSNKPRAHLDIGRRLFARLDSAVPGANPFAAVNHLNIGRSLIEDEAETGQLIRLNVFAAETAQQAAASAVAVGYLDIAIELLDGQGAKATQRFQLKLQRVVGVLQSGDTERALVLCDGLLASAAGNRERGEVYLLQSRVLSARACFLDAVHSVRNGLELVGVSLPQDPSVIDGRIAEGIGQMQMHLAGRSVEALLELPDMEDPDKILAMRLLFQGIPPAIQTFPPLFILIELTMFDLGLKHGLTEQSAKNFVDCGIIQGGILGDYEGAYRLGKLAFKVLERFHAQGIASSVNFVFATYVSSWRAPPQEALNAYDECYRLGVQTGNVLYVGFGLVMRLQRVFLLGWSLEDCARELEVAAATIERVKLLGMRAALVSTRRAIGRLCDTRASAKQNKDADELGLVRVREGKSLQWQFAYAETQLVVSVILGEYRQAESWRDQAAPLLKGVAGLLGVPEFHLFDALLQTRYKWPEASEEERDTILATVRGIQEKLLIWSENSPENFLHKYHLVSAELARIEQLPLQEVLEQYELAESAAGPDYQQLRALAVECQATLWKDKGREELYAAVIDRSRKLYEAWGARVKVRQLDSMLQPELSRTSESTSSDGLDLQSIMKATRAIATEVHSEDLFARLVQLLVENAGAERGALLVPDEFDGRLTLRVQAESSGQIRRFSSLALDDSTELCAELIRFAKRREKEIVLEDASADERFASSKYVREKQLKSALALPFVHQGSLVAIFYAENNLAVRAFPTERIATLQLLGGQAAISIVNARLYSNLEKEVRERTAALNRKNQQVVAMLNSMDQGVFQIGEDLTVRTEHSRQLGEMLGSDELAGRSMSSLLFSETDLTDSAVSACEFAVQCSFGVVSDLADGNRPHLVKAFSRTEPQGVRRSFECDWSWITDEVGVVQSVLVVLRDVTAAEELKRTRRKKDWEADTLASILNAGVEPFRAFCRVGENTLVRARAALDAGEREVGKAKGALDRDIHTLKGNARYLGLSSLVEQVHQAETSWLGFSANSGCSRETLRAHLTAASNSIAAFEALGNRKLPSLWDGDERRFQEAVAEIDQALAGAEARPSQPAPALSNIRRTIDKLRGVPLSSVLRDTTRAMPSLAVELGKVAPVIHCEGGATLLDAQWAQTLRDVFTHALRNSLDHGIEATSERQARGKSAEGHIRIDAAPSDGGLRIRLSDDGQGLPLERLRGLTTESEPNDTQLAESVFSSGITTSQRVSVVSGRGIGMGAVRNYIQEGGGSVRIGFVGKEEAGHRPFELVFDLPSSATIN